MRPAAQATACEIRQVGAIDSIALELARTFAPTFRPSSFPKKAAGTNYNYDQGGVVLDGY
jgi:hypothetical protein